MSNEQGRVLIILQPLGVSGRGCFDALDTMLAVNGKDFLSSVEDEQAK